MEYSLSAVTKLQDLVRLGKITPYQAAVLLALRRELSKSKWDRRIEKIKYFLGFK